MQHKPKIEEMATVWLDAVHQMADHEEVRHVSDLGMIVMQIGAITIRNIPNMGMAACIELQILAAMVYKATREYRENESASEVATDELLAMLARPKGGVP